MIEGCAGLVCSAGRTESVRLKMIAKARIAKATRGIIRMICRLSFICQVNHGESTPDPSPFSTVVALSDYCGKAQ